MRISVFLVGILLCSTLAIATATYTGKVVGVSDGDTLTLLTAEERQVKVRLAEIDTPESRQPYGTRAKQALSDLVFGKEVRVVVQDVDHYGRTMGRVYVGELDVNAEMIRQGAAWVYRQYAKDRTLFALEDEARAARRGLWALPEAERTPPWDWRKAQRSGGAAARHLPRSLASGSRRPPRATRAAPNASARRWRAAPRPASTWNGAG